MHKPMYALITGAALTLFGLSACHSSGSSTNPNVTPAPQMNATEQALAGRWQLVESHDTLFSYQNNVQDGVIPMDRTNYDATYFVTLKTDMAIAFNGQYPQARVMEDARIGGMVPGYWYFDNTNNRLYLSGRPYEILNRNATNLLIRGVLDSRSSGSGSIQATNYRFTK